MLKNRKKIVALLCIASLMTGCFFIGIPKQEVKASNNQASKTLTKNITEDVIPEGYKWFTGSDFHSVGVPLSREISSGDVTYIHDADSTLDKTVFTAYIKFSDSGTNRLYFGKSWGPFYLEGNNGVVRLRNGVSTAVIQEYIEDVAGCKLTGNDNLKLTISFEFEDNDGTNTDVKLGVFFNGKLYNNEYTTLENIPIVNLMQRCHTYVVNSNLTIRDAFTVIPTYLEEYTTSSIGMYYGSKNATTVLGRTTTDDTFFGVRVKFNRETDWFQYGGTGSWAGVRVRLSGSNLYAMCSFSELKNASGANMSVMFEPGVALGEEHTTFVGQEIDLHISTEVVNHDGTGTLDVRYGFYINGNLYNNTFVYSYNTADTLGNNVGFQNTIPVYASTGAISGKKVRTDLEQLSVNDINADSNAYAYKVIHSGYSRKGTYEASPNLVNKTFGVNLTLTGNSSKNSWFQIGGSGDWDGLRIKTDGTNLIICEAGVTATVVSPDFVGATTFNGTSTDVWISTELKNLNGGATADDVVYTVYIGDKLYTTLYVADKGSALSNRIVCQEWQAGSTFSAVEKTTKQIDIPKELVPITFVDFGMNGGEYSDSYGLMYTLQNNKINDFTETVFSGYFHFSSERTTTQGAVSPQASFAYASRNDQADSLDGIRISNHHTWVPTPDGVLNLTIGSTHVQLEPDIAGTQLVDKNIKISITITADDLDGDGNVTDGLVGIYINGKLYNNTLFKCTNLLESLGNKVKLYTAQSCLMIDSVEETEEEITVEDDDAIEISPYRGDKNEIDKYKDSPKKANYIFGGWYNNTNYSDTTAVHEDVTAGVAYAKYVNKDVMSVKAQVRTDASSTSPTKLRFVSTVDSLDYQEVGFYITVGGKTTRLATQTVYSQIIANDGGVAVAVTPKDFCEESNYFVTITIKNINSSKYDTAIVARPFWVTYDGTEVLGNEKTRSVNFGIAAQNSYSGGAMSKPNINSYSFDHIGGEDVMPIVGFYGPTRTQDSIVTVNGTNYKFQNHLTEEYFELIKGTGVNVITSSTEMDYASNPSAVKRILQLSEKYGMGYCVKDSVVSGGSYKGFMTQEQIRTRVNKYSASPAYLGNYLYDEPGYDGFLQTEVMLSDISPLFAKFSNLGLFGYGNLFPRNAGSAEYYQSYIQDYITNCKVPYVSYDYYPFNNTKDLSNAKAYFANLSDIRKIASKNAIPFWSFTQAGAHWDSKGHVQDNNYNDESPTEGGFYWSVGTQLAFGSKGISYFPLLQPEYYSKVVDSQGNLIGYNFNRNGLIGADGNKTKWYDYAQKMSTQIAAVDEVLMNSESMGVIFNAVEEGTRKKSSWSTYELDSVWDDIGDVETSESWFVKQGADKEYSCSWGTLSYSESSKEGPKASWRELTDVNGEAMIGCFNYQGKTALYVVNYDIVNSQNIILQFDKKYATTVIQDAKTRVYGETSITLSLEAGEGALIVFE